MRTLTSAVLLCFAALTAAAADLTISGTIYEDVNGDNDPKHLVARPGVHLRLYRDGGNDLPGDDDAAAGTTSSNANGQYEFHPSAPGVYWVAADASSVTPTAGWNDRVTTTARAEQTFGGRGTLCILLDGRVNIRREQGPCFAGRGVADNDAHLATSRSVARAAITAQSNATNVDFGFSYNAVTSINDAEAAGTLRQFIINANAVRGTNRMHFVPSLRAKLMEERSGASWWTINLTSPLPALSDAGTEINGTAYSIVDPTFVIDLNRGLLFDVTKQILTNRAISPADRPELEVVFSGATGLQIDGGAAIRNIAIGGASAANVSARQAVTIENSAIGAHADGTPFATPATTGLLVQAPLVHLDRVAVVQAATGVLLSPLTHVEANALFVTHCGTATQGAALLLPSSGSVILDSFFFDNGGPAIVIGGLDGTKVLTAQQNTIRGSIVSHNSAGIVLLAGASNNTIELNDIVWNALGGIVAPPSAELPKSNRISHNHFNENGGVPIDLQHQTDKVQVTAASCSNSNLAQNGLGAPQITNAEIVKISETQSGVAVEGKACPRTHVELYLSFVTSELREPIEKERARDLPSVREATKKRFIETRDTDEDKFPDVLPSIGEFNFSLTLDADANGNFRATLPLPEVRPAENNEHKSSENLVTFDAHDIFSGHRLIAVSATSMDDAGNTSEFSRRRLVRTVAAK